MLFGSHIKIWNLANHMKKNHKNATFVDEQDSKELSSRPLENDPRLITKKKTHINTCLDLF